MRFFWKWSEKVCFRWLDEYIKYSLLFLGEDYPSQVTNFSLTHNLFWPIQCEQQWWVLLMSGHFWSCHVLLSLFPFSSAMRLEIPQNGGCLHPVSQNEENEMYWIHIGHVTREKIKILLKSLRFTGVIWYCSRI